jgi:pectinesterase
VTFLNTEMSGVVRPAGWDNWRDPAREKTARYAEFNTTGAGANPSAHAQWATQLTQPQARSVTVDKVLAGSDDWNPPTVLARLPVVDFTSDAANPRPAAKP